MWLFTTNFVTNRNNATDSHRLNVVALNTFLCRLTAAGIITIATAMSVSPVQRDLFHFELTRRTQRTGKSLSTTERVSYKVQTTNVEWQDQLLVIRFCISDFKCWYFVLKLCKYRRLESFLFKPLTTNSDRENLYSFISILYPVKSNARL